MWAIRSVFDVDRFVRRAELVGDFLEPSAVGSVDSVGGELVLVQSVEHDEPLVAQLALVALAGVHSPHVTFEVLALGEALPAIGALIRPLA